MIKIKKHMNKFLLKKELSNLRKNLKNEKIILCHGVFDVLHHGHILHLKSAKKFGTILVVSITSDEFVNKGPNRPINNEIARMKFLTELEVVDYVYINKSKNATTVINILKPHYYVKGPDYKNKHKDKTKGIFAEENAIRNVGGSIKFTNDDIKSSTKIINEIFTNYDDEQLECLQKIKSKYSLSDLETVLHKIQNKKVLLIGEPIIDEYIFTQPLGLGSKSPIVSSKVLYKERYSGGVVAIAQNLAALQCNFKLLIPYPKKNKDIQILSSSILKHTKKIPIIDWEIPLKTRFVSEFQAQKIFETNEINENIWQKKNDFKNFKNEFLKQAKNCDFIIIADFGHGLFDKDMAEFINSYKKKEKYINVQTNSANLGFNFYNKFNNQNYLAIDERELRLAISNNNSRLDEILNLCIKNNQIKPPFSITLGKKGSIYVDEKKQFYSSPTFFRNVLDTTGAGDAYFLISSLLVANKCPSMLIPFISNLYAGLNTRHIANKNPVSLIDIERALKGITL